MKISTTLLLFFILSGLGTYYYVWERPALYTQTDPNPAQILMLKKGDSVSWLEIQNGPLKEKFSLRREGSHWKIEFPVSYAAEDSAVEEMIKALSASYRLRRFRLKESRLQEFGLDPAQLKITVETKKGFQQVLWVGGESPVKGRVYAHWEGEREYFLIPSEVRASLQKSFYSVRQKKLFRFKEDALEWIQIQLEETALRLERKEEKWRWIQPPLKKEIPLEKVTDLIYALQSLYIKEFLDGKNPASKEFGFGNKGLFLAAGEKGNVGEKVFLGGRAKGKDALYVLRNREDTALLVSQENLKSLIQTFEMTYQELKYGDTPEPSNPPRKNPASRPKRRARPLGGDPCLGDQECGGGGNPGSL